MPTAGYCPFKHFDCNDTASHCIPSDEVCDGEDDCDNGKDEDNCRKYKELLVTTTQLVLISCL